MRRKIAGVAVGALVVSAIATGMASPSIAQSGGDTRVSVGSPPSPFSENKQNEPALAVDANHPNILAAGANDEIDMEACNAGDDRTCPFTDGIGVSGIYFSHTSGDSWTQPTYQGLTARNCQGVVGNDDPGCTPEEGPIGTLPRYYENGLVSDGDPALAFGPKRGANGKFSWNNGSRLYYANLTANLSTQRSETTFKGFEAIAVSRTDDLGQTWLDPVVVSKQSNTTFSDKEQIWADNASQTSPYFGNVYLCWASFRGQENSPNAAPAPLIVAVSSDGGDTWTQHQLTAAANNSQRNPMDGCTVRTDSHGNAYVFGVGTSSSGGHQAFEFMSVSRDGGKSWSRPKPIPGAVTQPGVLDPVQDRPVIDGEAGARSDLAPAPSVDIANGAPTGTDATNRIVMTYVSGTLEHPHVYFTESTDLGKTWSPRRPIESAGDRGLFTAPAISPNGRDVYVVYNAFVTPYRSDTRGPGNDRELVGVVKHADVTGSSTGAFSEIHRGVIGDARGSSANALISEFLGDYVYAVATRTYGAAVWNDARNEADCPAIDAWRHGIRTDDTSDDVPRPAPQQECPANFGNSDIYGGSYADPTP
ncbi:MAG: glycoside hydrolase [Actinomycetota bacterium]|nr:glycoside hydrolase [Actinomycetota bacterium]